MASSHSHKLCMIPGPIEFHDEVLSTMSFPATSHIDPNFIKEFGESLVMLRQVFQCAKGQPFIVAGSGTLGWDMVSSNLVEPGESAVIINSGLFGDRFGECLETYGGKVTHLRAPIGDYPKLDEIARACKEKQPKVVTITHVDTSTGVLADVPAVARTIRENAPNALIILDGVCSVGGEALDMDAWGIDVALTASQKALGTPPGLCIVMASERAMSVFRSRKSPVTSYYASWSKWTPIMNAYENHKPSYFATPPVQLIKALHVSLHQIAKKPLAARIAQHAKVSDFVKDTVTSWGLKLVPVSRAVAANTLTAVYYPEGVAPAALLGAMSARGIVVAGGLHPEIAAKYFRIGHMGHSACADVEHIRRTLSALHEALSENGFQPKGAAPGTGPDNM